MTVTAAGRAFLRAASHACNTVAMTLPVYSLTGSELGVARPASVLPFLASTVAAPNVPTPSASEPLYHLALPLLAATGWARLRNTTAAEATWLQ